MSWYLWYPSVLRKYAVFSGRARRKEIWFFTLVDVLILIALSVIDAQLGLAGDTPYGVLFSLYCLATLLPTIAVAVRRLHDTGHTGVWVLLSFIPIGGLILLIWFTLDGQRGPNKYGPDPKGRTAAHEPGPMPPVPPPPPSSQSGSAGDEEQKPPSS